MACDICGKTGTPLNDLRNIYQTEDIKVLCPTCESIVNKKHEQIRKWAFEILARLLKQFMRVRKAQKGEKSPKHCN